MKPMMSNAAASRLVLAKYAEPLVVETAQSALAEVGGRVSCGVVFCSADYQENITDFLELLQLHAHIPLLVGCSGSGLIGTDAEAEMAEGFARRVAELTTADVRLIDERFSTASASRALTGAGKSAKKQRAIIDQAAAVVILETALDVDRQGNLGTVTRWIPREENDDRPV